MSGLVLHVSADATQLTTMENVLNRLERLLKNPTSVNLAGLTTQVNKLEKEAATTSGVVAGLEKTVNDLGIVSTKTAAGQAKLAKSIEGAGVGAGKAEASVNLLTASYSVLSKTAAQGNAALITLTKDMQVQGAAAGDLLANMAAVSPAIRKTMMEEQALASQVSLANAAFTKHQALIAEVNFNSSVLGKTLREEEIAFAKVAFAEHNLTKARYEAIVGISKETASVNLLTLSYSGFVKESLATAGGVGVLTNQLRVQGKEARELLVHMMALDPKIRELTLAEQTAAASIARVNQEYARQATTAAELDVTTTKFIATLRAEEIQRAKSALTAGRITKARYEEIVALNGQTVATNQLAAAGTNLNGAMRGAAGASGTLWLSYGAILPLLGAFAAVTTTIKSYKEALNFEYAVGYMESLGRATGDTTASLEQLRAGLLSIGDVAHGPNDLAISLKALMKAGFSAAESMGELQTLSRLATVAEEDLATTTMAVISQFRAWSVESVGAARGVNTMSEAANVLAAAALTTTLDVGELAKMMKYTPVLASQSAASFVELTAALGTMSNMGVRGTTAATSLRTAMLQLQSPTSKTRGILKDLGLEVRLFTDDGKLKSMSGMFDALAVSLRGLADKERLAVLKSMFSIRAGSAGAIMLNQFNKAVKEGTFSFQAQVEMLKEVQKEGRFIDDMYNDIAKTTTVMWEETKAALSRAMVSSVDTAPIRDLVSMMKEFAESDTLNTIASGFSLVVVGIMKAAKESAHLQTVLAAFKVFDGLVTGVTDKVDAYKAGVKGLTGETLVLLNAQALLEKKMYNKADLTQAEISDIYRLEHAYGSLGEAYVATEFDGKIQASSLKVRALADEQEEFFKGMRIAGQTPGALKIYEKMQQETAAAAETLAKLHRDKRTALEDPEDWKRRQDSKSAFEGRDTKDADEAAAGIKRAQDRRALDLNFQKLARADVLAADKFSLQMLNQKSRDQLVSLEEYRAAKKVIGDKILQDDLIMLNAELALAKDKEAEAIDFAKSQTATSNAEALARAAEKKVHALEQKVRQKNFEMVRSTEIFAGETNSIRLEAEREYMEASLQLTSKKNDRETALVLEGIDRQQQMLDRSRDAGLVK